MQKIYISLAIFLIAVTLNAQQTCTIEISYHPDLAEPSDEVKETIEYALSIWEDILYSPVPIKVQINWQPLFGTTLGTTIPNAIRNFEGATYEDVWYPSCLADAITKTDLQEGSNDIDINLNGATNYYLGTDGQPPIGTYDLVSLVLHEIGHGFGYIDSYLIDSDDGTASYGTISLSDLLPLSFPFESLDNRPFIYSYFVENEDGDVLVDQDLFPNESEELADFLTSDLYFNGPFTLEANDGERSELYSPNSFAFGSSVLHLDENNYEGTDNMLMTPFLAQQEVTHAPGPLMLANLQDLGWTFEPPVANEDLSNFKVSAYPNPFVNELSIMYYVSKPTKVSIQIYDMMGKCISTLANHQQSSGYHCIKWDVENEQALNNGTYIVRMQVGNSVKNIKLTHIK